MAVPVPASQAGTAPTPERAAQIATAQTYVAPAPKSESTLYLNDAVCARCGKETKVSFKPDGVRPVFCKECLSILREEKTKETNDRKRMKQEELQNLHAAPAPTPAAPLKTLSLKDIPREAPAPEAESETGTLKPGKPVTF